MKFGFGLSKALRLICVLILLARAAIAGEGDSLLSHLERAYAAAADRIAPSIVTLDIERDPAAAAAADAARGEPSGPAPAYALRPDGAAVSGVALSPDRVLTTAWNVTGAKAIRVLVPGGKRLEAKVLGRDDALDLALLAVSRADDDTDVGDASPLVPVRLPGPESAPAVGAWLVAVGAGALAAGGPPNLNAGIVSAHGRFRGDALQTDAALNYGNYGGAAVDIEGRFIGLPVRLSVRAGVNSGVGFVIPLARIRDVLPFLERGEIRKAPPRPYLGVQFGKEMVEPPGVEIARVVDGTAAAAAGLERGDILRMIGDVPAVDSAAVADAIQSQRPGDRLYVEVTRDGKRIGFEVTLGERPADR